jgi:predicted amidohydrolase
MRVSLIQLAVTDEESPAERRRRAVDLVAAERDLGADLIVLPELWEAGGFAYDKWQDAALPVADLPVLADLRTARSKREGLWLHTGSHVEAGADGATYNTSILLGPDDADVRYRKIHRFGFDAGEAVLMGAGEEIVTVPSPFGTFGLATCYDLRFPELFRLLTDAGAELLLVASAWPERRIEHWRVLNRARAIESQVFVFAANCAGTHGGVKMGGRSVVVDPWGDVVAEAGTDDEEVLRAEIDPALVGETRKLLPVLRDQRLRG